MFRYKPIYYDEKEEERRKLFGAVDGTFERESKDKKYVPGSYVQGAFRDGNYARRKGSSKVSAVISIIGLIIFAVMLIMVTKFYSLL